MDCPKCRVETEVVTIGGIAVERCTRCQGLWFEGGDLTRLRAMEGSEKIDVGSAEMGKQANKIDHIACPRCNVLMIRMVDQQQHHIWFESCKVCKGVFFDAGEFRDLKHHTLADYFRDFFTKERK